MVMGNLVLQGGLNIPAPSKEDLIEAAEEEEGDVVGNEAIEEDTSLEPPQGRNDTGHGLYWPLIMRTMAKASVISTDC